MTQKQIILAVVGGVGSFLFFLGVVVVWWLYASSPARLHETMFDANGLEVIPGQPARTEAVAPSMGTDPRFMPTLPAEEPRYVPATLPVIPGR